LVSAPLLSAGRERLAARLDQLRTLDSRRISSVSAFAEGRTCLRQYLEQYFGDHARGECGRCSSCRGSVLPGLDLPVDTSSSRRAPVETFSVGRSDGFGLALAAPARQARPLTAKLADFGRGR